MVAALERKGGGSRGDVEPFDLGQRVDNLLGDAVAEGVLIFAATKVFERKDGDRGKMSTGWEHAPVTVFPLEDVLIAAFRNTDPNRVGAPLVRVVFFDAGA
jgi:hypothetical protein